MEFGRRWEVARPWRLPPGSPGYRQDTPIRMNAKRPAGPNAIRQLSVEASSADKERGALLYADRCASCHAENGAGIDENPPVWGANVVQSGCRIRQRCTARSVAKSRDADWMIRH